MQSNPSFDIVKDLIFLLDRDAPFDFYVALAKEAKFRMQEYEVFIKLPYYQQRAMECYQKLEDLVERMQADKIPHETGYNFCWNLKDNGIDPFFDHYGIHFDYCDPDTTYLDGVLAFWNALKEVRPVIFDMEYPPDPPQTCFSSHQSEEG